MRRILYAGMLLACLLLFSSCKGSGGELQEALDFRTALLDATSCGFTAEVTADYGQRVYEFSLDCTYHQQENTAELEVIAPETISGIKASVDGEDASVSFEDTVLSFGTMAGGHVAPLQLPQLLGDAWVYGYLETVSKSDDGQLATYRTGYGDNELLIYTYFDSDMKPTRAEVYYDDQCVLRAKLSDYSVT